MRLLTELIFGYFRTVQFSRFTNLKKINFQGKFYVFTLCFGVHVPQSVTMIFNRCARDLPLPLAIIRHTRRVCSAEPRVADGDRLRSLMNLADSGRDLHIHVYVIARTVRTTRIHRSPLISGQSQSTVAAVADGSARLAASRASC